MPRRIVSPCHARASQPSAASYINCKTQSTTPHPLPLRQSAA